MSDEHAKSFVADGPTLRGFETGGPNIQIGVYAKGKQTGVHGIGAEDGAAIMVSWAKQQLAKVFGVLPNQALVWKVTAEGH